LAKKYPLLLTIDYLLSIAALFQEKRDDNFLKYWKLFFFLNQLFVTSMNKLYSLLVCCFLSISCFSQTVVINPATGGGFESVQHLR